MLHLDDAAALERRSVPLEVEKCSLPQGDECRYTYYSKLAGGLTKILRTRLRLKSKSPKTQGLLKGLRSSHFDSQQ
jgi:hypothetical protein